MSNLRQIRLGAPIALGYTALGFSNYTFVNTTDQVEFIFQVPDPADGTRSVTITQLGYRLSSVTGTSPVMKISLQGVDASGNPDGTIKGGGSPASQTFTPAGTSTWNWVTLANPFAASAGDFLAIVIAYSSGTLNGANTPMFTLICASSNNNVLPYAIQNVAGTRTRQAQQAIYGFQTASKAFGFPLMTQTATAFSTTNERALRFFFEQALVQSYKVVGVRLALTTPAAGKSVKVILYQGTTALQTVTWDSDAVAVNGSTRMVDLWFQDASLTTLFGGQEYRIGVQPQDASNNVALHQLDVTTASDLEAYPGGQNWYLSTRASGGATAWTDVLTSRPYAELIVSDWTVPPPGIIVAA